MARKGKKKQISKQSQLTQTGTSSKAINELENIQNSFKKGDLVTAHLLANEFTSLYGDNPQGWEMLSNIQAQQQDLKSACQSMQKALDYAFGEKPLSELKLAQYELLAGYTHEAIKRLKTISGKIPKEKKAWVLLSKAYHAIGLNNEALEANNKAYELDVKYPTTLMLRSRIFDQLKRHSDSYDAAKKLKNIAPTQVGVSNYLATLSLREGDYEAAEKHFSDELKLGDNSEAAYNSFIAKHYNPNSTAEELAEIVTNWQTKYINNSDIVRASTKCRENKLLRIGLLSGSFRRHPVGQMILPALQQIDKSELELFFYTTSQIVDSITLEIKKVADNWTSIFELNDEQLNQKIRQDKIDILIDMNGGGEGSRFIALAKEPSPLIVKWVGILINTTGLKCFDYLISDSIETPQNVDHLYTEKLIRMPDDYVCYHFPAYIPKVNSLPALENQFITFGCLNNPAKLSSNLINEWSKLLSEVPNSRLLLRGIQFDSDSFCRRIVTHFAECGISQERLLLEGPAQHKDFLKTYQRIDIALDTWPYSGGLTTCEALAMGVPVVTCVGPTFAGRHSATHLANAGLPELVTDNWDDFRQRAKELANDLPNLAVIRAALRSILKESPVCDGERFAKNLTTALRGIWQRHCEGKAPEALTFNKEGDAWFADEEKPIELVEVEGTEPKSQEFAFGWKLESPITVIDNGSLFARHPNFAQWMKTEYFAVVTFDPGSLLTKQADELKQLGEWHHYAHALLGDGKEATLYATLEPQLTGTLKPLESKYLSEQQQQKRQVLAQLPIDTLKLDDIDGLPSVDLLVLDALNDAMAVLENGSKYLKDTLIIQVKIVFQATHKRQLNLAELQHWSSRNDFRLYTLQDLQYYNHFPQDVSLEKTLSSGSELISADVLLLPSFDRLQALSKDKKNDLAFLLSQVYNLHDISYLLLTESDEQKAESYLNKIIALQALQPRSKNLSRVEKLASNKPTLTSAVSANCEKAVSDLKDALCQRKMVFVNTGSMANHGIVQMAQKRLFSTLEASGCAVEFLDASEVKPRELLDIAASEESVLYGANRYFDMSVNISGYGNHNVFQAYQSPVIGTINDHPYTNFMLDRVSKAPAVGLLLARGAFGEELAFLRPDLKYIFSKQLETASAFYPDCDKPHAKRDIDVLVPMNLNYALNSDKLHENLMFLADSYGANYRLLVKKVLNTFKVFSYSLLSTFRVIYKDVFGLDWEVQLPWSNEDIKLLKLLGQLDDLFRANKRMDALKVISHIDSSARVVVLAPPEMQEILYRKLGAKNIRDWQFIGTCSFEKLEKLYTRSRYVLNVFPTYHDWLHERVRGAAAAGCALITNYNQRAGELFTHGKDALFYDQHGGGELYSYNVEVSESIGFAAQALLNENLISEDDGIGQIYAACATYLKQLDSDLGKTVLPKADSPAVTLPSAPYMSEKERMLFNKALEEASSYFEFGSGGSTVWAVKKGLVVRGVESDKLWVEALKNQLGENCQLKFIDIGPTGDWGMPTSNRYADRFELYSRSILEFPEPFDLVLVDGRFRIASTLAVVLHILKTSSSPQLNRIFIHDFWSRPHYHCVLDFLEPVEKAETAGLFVIKNGITVKRVESEYRRYIRDVR